MSVMKTRPGSYDEQIIQEVRTAYYPDVIDYSSLRTVVDIGAHIGAYSLFVLEHAPLADITAVEMDSENYDLLAENTWHETGINTLYAYASYHPGQMLNVRDLDNLGSNTLTRLDEVGRYRPLPENRQAISPDCKRVTLEDLLAPFACVDLLKLDCEGSEYDIISHALPETLAKCRWIVGEYHTFAGDFRALVNTLTNFEIVRWQDAPDWGHFLLRNKA